MRLLRSHGDTLSKQDDLGRSPLYLTITKESNEDALEYLVEEARVDLNQKDKDGMTVFDMSQRTHWSGFDVGEYIVEHGASGDKIKQCPESVNHNIDFFLTFSQGGRSKID